MSDDEDVRRFALRAYRFDFAFHIAFVDVCVCAYAFFGERASHLFRVIVKIGSDGNDGRLFEVEPRGKSSGVVFDEDADKAFERSEHGAVQHNRMVLLIVLSDVFRVEPFA